MGKDLYVNWRNLADLVSQFKSKIDSIERCYNELNALYKELDGSTPTWYGDNQKKFYEVYQSISREFPKNVAMFNKFCVFLNNAKTSYENSDSANVTSIDKSEDDLMV